MSLFRRKTASRTEYPNEPELLLSACGAGTNWCVLESEETVKAYELRTRIGGFPYVLRIAGPTKELEQKIAEENVERRTQGVELVPLPSASFSAIDKTPLGAVYDGRDVIQHQLAFALYTSPSVEKAFRALRDAPVRRGGYRIKV